jgi:hypothetical protein
MRYVHIRKAVRTLAAIFGIPTPRVVITRNKSSSAYMSRNEIRIGRRDWHGMENAMLHEFAHILHHARVKYPPLAARFYHNRGFFSALCRVIIAWRGTARRYPWHKEYRHVWRRAYRLGYTSTHWR